MATAPALTHPTTLAFRTPPGGVKIQPGKTTQLGVVDVHNFNEIRLVCDERVGSGANCVIRFTIMDGSELVAQLDTITLTPHSQITKTYNVPGVKLGIFADAIGTGEAGVDVLVFGN
jgi:type III secretion protein HrpB1